jgi:hypothetical protein
MPAVTLGSALAAIVTRISRSSVLEVMRQDYVITARAKGLNEKTVIWRHILRNALITIVTILGLQLGALAQRLGGHRNGFFLSGHRRSLDPVDLGARLQAHPGFDLDVRRDLFRRQLVGRCALQLDRSRIKF